MSRPGVRLHLGQREGTDRNKLRELCLYLLFPLTQEVKGILLLSQHYGTCQLIIQIKREREKERKMECVGYLQGRLLRGREIKGILKHHCEIIHFTLPLLQFFSRYIYFFIYITLSVYRIISIKKY